MIKEWEIEHPDRSAVIFNALKNTHPSHLLDKKLFDFTQPVETVPISIFVRQSSSKIESLDDLEGQKIVNENTRWNDLRAKRNDKESNPNNIYG